MRNIVWTQRGNLMSTPNDCPQRDERFGWMGDIQAFSQTAIFNMDLAAFFMKFAQDIRDDQADDGRYPDFAPHPGDPNQSSSGVPAWGDAGTIVPWRAYQNYADARLIEDHFDSARRWVDYIHKTNPDLVWAKGRHNDYNDWLNGDWVKLQHAAGVVVTEHGPVPVSWTLNPNGLPAAPGKRSAALDFAFDVPAGVQAKLSLPRMDDR